MRCYTTNYSSSWMYFHSTPWWYRSNYSWYDTRGCPPHYYYDRASGICRYYGAHGGGGGGGGSSTQSSVPRRNSRVVPEESISTGVVSGTESPMFSNGATKQLSPVSSPSQSASQPNSGLSKPDAPNPQQQQEPQQQQPEQKPKNEAPKSQPPTRRSSRGI